MIFCSSSNNPLFVFETVVIIIALHHNLDHNNSKLKVTVSDSDNDATFRKDNNEVLVCSGELVNRSTVVMSS